jgi:hypothetical protein
VERESLVAGAGLALGTGERVLGVRLGVQEDREIRSHGPVALAQQLRGIGADHDVVAVLHRQAEQLVAHRAADEVGLHHLPAKWRYRE